MPDHEFLPARDDSRVPHVGTYTRTLPVSLERLYENALDWEHLPHQHRTSFAALTCLDWGAWGWRAAVTDSGGRDSVIELRLDRERRRWITRTMEGHGAGAEIWTHAFTVEPRRVDIVVDFFVPGFENGTGGGGQDRQRVGAAFARLYERLYDEDVAMMTERQRQLDRRVEGAGQGAGRMPLGPRSGLELPLALTLAGREFFVVEVDGELAVFPRQCPHQLGPLTPERLDGGVVTCPWHGYRFDVRSGANLDGGSCRLRHLPAVETDADDNVWLVAS